jgi:biopolymer transport protein ExbB/TolQ
MEMGKAAFAPNIDAASSIAREDLSGGEPEQRGTSSTLWSAGLGLVMTLGFYAMVLGVPWQPLKRYFLGHPIAVATTLLFWVAVGLLAVKWLRVLAQTNQVRAIRDEDLLPPSGSRSPAGRWLEQHDAGHVARNWLVEIARLPSETRRSPLVTRLQELLTRQSQRGTAKHLADDLRELSARDADAAHDSLGLVRIIAWAIPMLGFLGTVVGITQTLGDLDFSNGATAVENLKSGLYVAFDTTAIGLVLSVMAIFMQFPIERSEQGLLATIDARVGHLVSASLPSDETSDNQTALIADLCQGVQAAVAESLDNQAKLWRETIDEAQLHWQRVHEENNNRIAEAFERTLVPALAEHARRLGESSREAGDRFGQACDLWQATLEEAQTLVRQSNQAVAGQVGESLRSVMAPALRDHAATLDESAQVAADRLERQWQQWQETIAYNSDTLSSQQLLLIRHYEALTETHHQARSIAALQQAMDNSLQQLAETNASIDRSIQAAAGEGMADAMRILARAVDVLTRRLAETSSQHRGESNPSASRRAA